MPTGTTTMTTSNKSLAASLRVPSAKAPSTSGIQALRAMYQRAARAFLKRNTAEAQDLIDAAFHILSPPASPQPDQMSSQRKKWDILRITLETTLYTSPALVSANGRPRSPATTRTSSPTSANNIRSHMLLSPPSLLATLHTRSLRLFTPPSLKPSPAFLPPQILLSLVIASLKLECPQVGRGMVEEWLARRSPPELGPLTSIVDDGYAKVVDVYCLHILPRLGEWDYASEFLRYEVELPADRRAQIAESLKRLHSQSLVPASPPPPYRTKSLDGSRQSSVESLNGRHSRASSTSSYTAIPATPKPGDILKPRPSNSRKNTLSASMTSIGSKEGARAPSQASTVRPVEPVPNPHDPTTLNHAMSAVTSPSPLPQSPLPPLTPPTLMAQLKLHFDTLRIHYLPLLKARLPFILCVLLPMIALVAELRRRSRAAAKAVNKGRSAEQLRKHLQGGTGMWSHVAKAIRDTVMMAGKGLV